jgi:hypothetical protein
MKWMSLKQYDLGHIATISSSEERFLIERLYIDLFRLQRLCNTVISYLRHVNLVATSRWLPGLTWELPQAAIAKYLVTHTQILPVILYWCHTSSRSPWGNNTYWGCMRTGCWGEYLDLGGRTLDGRMFYFTSVLAIRQLLEVDRLLKEINLRKW